MIKLGEKAKDKVTGFEGIVMARAEYLNGCITLLVQPKGLSRDGSLKVAYWIDEQRLTVKSRATAGGPQQYPPAMHP